MKSYLQFQDFYNAKGRDSVFQEAIEKNSLRPI